MVVLPLLVFYLISMATAFDCETALSIHHGDDAFKTNLDSLSPEKTTELTLDLVCLEAMMKLNYFKSVKYFLETLFQG
jgi:hypothetical protein